MSIFNNAYNKRNSPTGFMFHTDRGTQYTAVPFRKLLDKFHLSFLTNFRIFMSIYLTIVHFNSSISEMSFSLFGTIIGSNVEFLSCRTVISRSP